eukprot:5036087-Heterocapsa_arctica.AAC.1
MLSEDSLLIVGLAGHFLRLLRLSDRLVPVGVDTHPRGGSLVLTGACPSLDDFPCSVALFLRSCL